MAVRTASKLICCHSLPANEFLREFDPEVINRELTDRDFAQGGSAYNLIWGTNHDASVPQRISEAWDVKFFLLGHQPQREGYRVDHDQILIIDSHHDNGTALPIDLSRDYTMEELVKEIVPLWSADD